MNRPQPPMRWLAHTNHKVGSGARLFVQEAMQSPAIRGHPIPSETNLTSRRRTYRTWRERSSRPNLIT